LSSRGEGEGEAEAEMARSHFTSSCLPPHCDKLRQFFIHMHQFEVVIKGGKLVWRQNGGRGGKGWPREGGGWGVGELFKQTR
jgi:hypothetical protein